MYPNPFSVCNPWTKIGKIGFVPIEFIISRHESPISSRMASIFPGSRLKFSKKNVARASKTTIAFGTYFCVVSRSRSNADADDDEIFTHTSKHDVGDSGFARSTFAHASRQNDTISVSSLFSAPSDVAKIISNARI